MTIRIRANGQELEGFVRGTLTLTMDEAVNSFEVEYALRDERLAERALYPGDACAVVIDDEIVLDGFVDRTDDVDEPDEVRVRVSGRSKTCDLYDCSAGFQGFTSAKVSTIARALAQNTTVRVHVEGDEGQPFPAYHVQKGESILDAINRAALKRGLYAYTVGGDLVLARAGARETRTCLVRGTLPLVRSARTDSWEQRFSHYVFRGQVPATDDAWGKKASISHALEDKAVKRYRPLHLHVEARNGIDVQTRAATERNLRAARGERITATVWGHKTDEGHAWRPNLRVAFDNPVLGVRAMLLVSRVSFRFGADEPDQADLELVRPEAYDVAGYPPLKRGELWT